MQPPQISIMIFCHPDDIFQKCVEFFSKVLAVYYYFAVVVSHTPIQMLLYTLTYQLKASNISDLHKIQNFCQTRFSFEDFENC